MTELTDFLVVDPKLHTKGQHASAHDRGFLRDSV